MLQSFGLYFPTLKAFLKIFTVLSLIACWRVIAQLSLNLQVEKWKYSKKKKSEIERHTHRDLYCIGKEIKFHNEFRIPLKHSNYQYGSWFMVHGSWFMVWNSNSGTSLPKFESWVCSLLTVHACAKSLQSCLTLCDPFLIHGTLQEYWSG